jgi:Concanavalin A-like lectin/glucanases superfamily
MWHCRRPFALVISLGALAILVIAAPPASQAQVVHYAAEGNFADSSGNGRTATVNGSIGFRSGGPGFGQGFDVDNVVNTTATNFLTVPGLSGANASNLSGTGLTVAAFFREDNFANNGSLANMRTNNQSGFSLEPAFGAPGSFLFFVFTSAGGQQIIAPGFTVGGLHHIAAVFDPANQLVSVYRDGLLVLSGPTAGTQPMLIQNNETFTIGRNFQTSTGFDGMIDEFKVFNRPLTAGEVLALVPEPASFTLALLPASLFVARRLRRNCAISTNSAV